MISIARFIFIILLPLSLVSGFVYNFAQGIKVDKMINSINESYTRAPAGVVSAKGAKPVCHGKNCSSSTFEYSVMVEGSSCIVSGDAYAYINVGDNFICSKTTVVDTAAANAAIQKVRDNHGYPSQTAWLIFFIGLLYAGCLSWLESFYFKYY